jgi:hypothetical protein
MRRFACDESTRSADWPSRDDDGERDAVPRAREALPELRGRPAHPPPAPPAPTFRPSSRARDAGVKAVPARASYFLGRERLLPHGTSPMARWRKRVFVLMARNAHSATEFFGLPSNRVVELGAQIEF